MDVVHMVEVFVIGAICLIGIATGEYAVGKFGILMPKVRPYRVSVQLITINDIEGNRLC